MRTRTKRALSVVTAAVIALTGVGYVPGASAAAVKQPPAATSPAATQAGDTGGYDVSARRRHRGNAAAIGAAAAIFGTVATIAAANAARRQHRDYGYYGYGYNPYPYGGYGGYAYRPYYYGHGYNNPYAKGGW